tara:strand:+ start:2775 stop:4916 length:2142 start_codon:yes stop_codon:yes gene_type:complete
MAKTKAQLRTENLSNFPNNNSQFITPQLLRDFNNDIIDAVALEANSQLSGTGSFSNLSGSGYVSASFFIGDGSKLVNVPGATPVSTGSLLVTSSFDSGTRLQTFTKGDGSTYTNSIPGGTIDTGSFMKTGSVSDATSTFTKGDGTTFGLTVNNVVNSTSSSHSEFSETAADVIVGVKNTSGVTLPKGTPVYATGVTGENINIASASNDSSTTMPAIGLLSTELTNNSSGTVFTSGKLVGVNTNGFTAGRNIYVNLNGGFTQTKPTGTSLIQNIGVVGKVNVTDGEILIQGSGRSNDLPNILEGYAWVGNGSGVATAVSTASWDDQSDITSLNEFTSSITTRVDGLSAETSSYAKTDVNNTFTGTQNFLNINVSGTGSFGRINSVTGSAKIIGDAFVVVNADTPTLRYAGLQVYDSGSSSTASLEWDGLQDSWILVEEGGQSSFLLTGPTGSKGSEVNLTNNSLPKAGVHRQLVDSNITDSGTLITLNSNTDVQGNITTTGTVDGVDVAALNTEVQVVSSSVHQINQDTGSFATLGANTFTGPQLFTNTLDLRGAVSSSTFISASAFIGNGSQLTGLAGGIFLETGSFYSTTNDVAVTGSFNVKGGIGGEKEILTITSLTASIDLTTSNTYELTLVSSADTHLDISTYGSDGQSINVLVKQPAAGNTGSISFSPDFKFGNGYSYIPTAANSSEDIVSFTKFSTFMYGTFINNFS